MIAASTTKAITNKAVHSFDDDQNKQAPAEAKLALIKYFVTGSLFGIVFVKAEILSWFRIQEMFRLQSFHMYGVIGSAIITGMISLQLIRKLKMKTL